MAKNIYQPPKQGTFGMIFDSLLMLVLVFYALQAPQMIKGWSAQQAAAPAEATATDEAAPAEEAAPPAVTWDDLKQNPAMQQAWEKLGKDPAAAQAIINNKFDYTIDYGKLLLVAGMIAVYFFFMLSVSAKQYKDVIAEKFD